MGTIYGSMSWYDSGPNNTTACGNPFSTSIADSTSFVAWPLLNGYPGNPASACNPYALNCETTITVQNICNGWMQRCPVIDHAGSGVMCQYAVSSACTCTAARPRILDASKALMFQLGNSAAVSAGWIPVLVTF